MIRREDHWAPFNCAAALKVTRNGASLQDFCDFRAAGDTTCKANRAGAVSRRQGVGSWQPATARQPPRSGPLGLENPMGTDGFEFVEYAAPDPELLRALFAKMGFPAVARHKRKNVTLHRQADINFIINAEPGSFAEKFAEAHGPCACAMAFRVKDAKAAHDRAMSLGATDIHNDVAEGELDIPAIEGIGGSLALSGRPLRRQRHHLRRRFRIFSRRRGAGGEPRLAPHLPRPSHPQCESRADGALGRFLRAALQLPRDSLFRHRREGHRAVLEGDDPPVRQDPHPAQREPGRQEPDRGVPARV